MTGYKHTLLGKEFLYWVMCVCWLQWCIKYWCSDSLVSRLFLVLVVFCGYWSAQFASVRQADLQSRVSLGTHGVQSFVVTNRTITEIAYRRKNCTHKLESNFSTDENDLHSETLLYFWCELQMQCNMHVLQQGVLLQFQYIWGNITCYPYYIVGRVGPRIFYKLKEGVQVAFI